MQFKTKENQYFIASVLMSNTRITLLLSLIVICFNSCVSLFQNKEEGLWFYTYSSGESSFGFKLTPASFLCLNPDKSFTLDFGKFQYGKWTTKGDTLILNATKPYYFLINNISGTDMRLNPEPGVTCNFEKQHYSFSADAVEPFSLKNNQWRIPARHKETPAQIKERLVNHCHFWKDYFTWALNNEMATIDVRSIPTPIKIYGNGFALKAFEDLPSEWQSYFYDAEDCKLANTILQHVFEHNDIAWAHTDNKYKMFIGAFEQVEQLLQVD